MYLSHSQLLRNGAQLGAAEASSDRDDQYIAVYSEIVTGGSGATLFMAMIDAGSSWVANTIEYDLTVGSRSSSAGTLQWQIQGYGSAAWANIGSSVNSVGTTTSYYETTVSGIYTTDVLLPAKMQLIVTGGAQVQIAIGFQCINVISMPSYADRICGVHCIGGL